MKSNPEGKVIRNTLALSTWILWRSRYVPVRRNFAVFCVLGVSKNQ
jgi:hypothetical protein